MNKSAYVYKITNKVNFKSYIGITRDRAVFMRWNEHLNSNHELSNDFKLYGIESFSFEVLESLDSISDKDLFKLESLYIEQYDTINKGYNKILSHAKPNREKTYTDKAVKSMEKFKDQIYIGTPTNNSNGKLSFWDGLIDENLCFVTLLTSDNYLTRESKYQKILHVLYKDRPQRFFRLQTLGQDYYTDNLLSVIDLLSVTYKKSRLIPYELISVEIEHDCIRVKVTMNELTREIKVYSPLLYEDEVIYYMPLNDVRSLFSADSIS